MPEEDKNNTSVPVVIRSFLDEGSAFIVVVGVLVALFGGTPDIADAIIFALSDGALDSGQ